MIFAELRRRCASPEKHDEVSVVVRSDVFAVGGRPLLKLLEPPVRLGLVHAKLPLDVLVQFFIGEDAALLVANKLIETSTV